MWKKIIIGSIFVLILSIPQISLATQELHDLWMGAYDSGVTGSNDCYNFSKDTWSDATYRYYVSIYGVYATSAEASAARTAFATTHGGSSYNGYAERNRVITLNEGTTTYPAAIIRTRNMNVPGIGLVYHYVNFLYGTVAGCEAPDPSEYNPFPDASIFRWKEVGRQYDSEGNVIGQLIVFSDPITGETKTEYFGDSVSDHCTQQEIDAGLCPISLVLNDYWRPGSEFNDLYGDSDVGDDPFSPIGHITPGATVPGVTTDQTGVGDAGSNDTELLQNIATNTRFNTANQQIISDQLTDMTNAIIDSSNQAGQIGASVSGGLGTANSLLADIRDGIESLEVGGGETDLSGLIDESTEFGVQTGTEWDGILSEINAFKTELGIPEESEYYQEGDINTPEDFTLGMESLFAEKESSSLFQGIKNILIANRIQTSGSCSASVSLWGHNIELTVCGMAGPLEIFGNVLLGIATISAILIAFRG